MLPGERGWRGSAAVCPRRRGDPQRRQVRGVWSVAPCVRLTVFGDLPALTGLHGFYIATHDQPPSERRAHGLFAVLSLARTRNTRGQPCSRSAALTSL